MIQLGAIGFSAREPGVWAAFLRDVLGLVDIGAGRFRMDGHAWRIQLEDGTDDLSFVAWEMDDARLDATLGRLRAAGVDVAEADPAERSAARRYRFVDPGGVATELVAGLARATEPFASPVVRNGFVADDLGLGHVVLSTVDKARSVRLYTELLGFTLSDHVVCEMYGHSVDLSFFHANPRHHSVAFGGPQPHRLNHFMIEARDLDEVGLAHDRTLAFGLPVFLTPGRHPNDRMLSFYAKSPGGFQFEFGWGARTIDDEASWRPRTYDRISDWGHQPPQIAYGRKR